MSMDRHIDTQTDGAGDVNTPPAKYLPWDKNLKMNRGSVCTTMLLNGAKKSSKDKITL